MAINPQIHPGWESTISIEIFRETPNMVLYPLEEGTARTARYQADCLENHPIAGRIFAVPIAMGDTLCSIPVLAIDTIWSVAGCIFSGLASLATCCCWRKSRHATKDFTVATGRNLGEICCNVCIGPMQCAGMSIAACKSPVSSSDKCKLFWCAVPRAFIIYPFTCGYGIYSICKDPKEAGGKMKEGLAKVYNV